METKTIEAPEVKVTAEMLQQKAAEVGKNLREIKVSYPKTAGVLLLGSTIVDEQGWNDPDALTAKSMAMDYEYDNAGNAINLSNHLFSGRERVVDVNRVNQGLDRLATITAERDPKKLLEQIEKQLGDIRSKLITDGQSMDETNYLINHSKPQHYEAREELRMTTKF